MYKKIILVILILSHVSACSTLGNKRISTIQETASYNQISNKFSDTNDSSTGRKLMAYPFWALGAIMMGFGGLLLLTFDAENSETEKQSEAQNGLIGLGLFGGGYFLWELGNQIEQ